MGKKIMIPLYAVLALLLMFAVFSCKKAIIPEEESAIQNGNLRVSVYQIEKTPFASLTRAGKTASEVVTHLNFAIYDPFYISTRSFVQNQAKNQLAIDHCLNHNPIALQSQDRKVQMMSLVLLFYLNTLDTLFLLFYLR